MEEDQYSCLCNDNSFMSSVAQCTYADCEYTVLEDTASRWVSDCGSGFTAQEIVNAGVGCEFDTIPSTTYILQSITIH